MADSTAKRVSASTAPPPKGKRRHRAKGTSPRGPADFLALPRVGALDSVKAWRIEVGRLYRAMRRGEVPAEIGTKLAFVAKVGAQLMQAEEELSKVEQLRVAVEAAEARQGFAPALPYAAPHPAGAAISGELMPRIDESEEAQ